MDKPEACDVVYHKYAADSSVDKPLAVAIPVEDSTTAQPLAPLEQKTPKQGTKSLLLRALCRGPALLGYHLANAALGIGGAIIVLVTLPLSIGLLPLACSGAVLYQILGAVVRWLAKVDILLANMTNGGGEMRMKVAFGIQSGFSRNIGRSGFVARLFFVSPKALLVMLYFATIKLVIGCLSLCIGECVIGAPIQIIVSGGGPVTFGNGLTYDNHPTAYVAAYLGMFLVGIALLAPVRMLSVQLTRAFCADRGEEVAAAATPAVNIETPRVGDAKGAVF